MIILHVKNTYFQPTSKIQKMNLISVNIYQIYSKIFKKMKLKINNINSKTKKIYRLMQLKNKKNQMKNRKKYINFNASKILKK